MQCADSEARDADGVLVDEGEAAVCRICYAEEFEEDRGGFVRPTPCQCLGNRRFVHTSCLARWQTTAFRKRQWAAGTVCHACDSPYLVDLADKRARTPVAVVGGTGLVGRALAIRLLTHPTLRLGAVVGSDASAGRGLRAVWEAKEAELARHYGAHVWAPLSFPEALDGVVVQDAQALEAAGPTACPYVVSCIAPRLGHIEDALQAAGFVVFSISPHARTDLAHASR